MIVQPSPRRFTVAEYYKMAEAGILRPGDRVELLDGEIIQMSPIGPVHAGNVDQIARLFITRLGERAWVRVQNPIRLNNRSEPEPDLAVLRPRPSAGRSYLEVHPVAADVLLVVEVADTSLSYDLGRKARAYARSQIPELWVLDRTGDRLLVHREPGPRGYAAVQILGRGESISPLAFPDLAFTVDELLG